jgi:hypothetical protein
MNTTTLTPTDLDNAAQDDRYLGFGYLSGRRHILTEDPTLVARVDTEVIAHANAAGWTYEDLFTWANSKNGRWFADSMFSGTTMEQATAWGLMNLPA